MEQGIFKIVSNSLIADKTYRMCLEGDKPAAQRAGQFVDIAIEGRFLRRPLAVTEWNGNRFSMIYKVVGEGTREMSLMTPGGKLDLLTCLGNGFDPELCRGKALVVCGGIGASPVFTLVKELISLGRKVTVVMGFNRACEVMLENEMKALGAEVHVATMDGSKGFKGLVTELITDIKPEFDFFYTCGPKVMMKAVCEQLPTSGQLSMEERMGCGCGICYGCSCHTKNGPRRICADGPVFMKEEMVW